MSIELRHSVTNWTLFDKLVAFAVVAILLYSIAILANAYLAGENIAAWVWERHQNQFSWYSRPLFIIPACYYAYRQKLWLVIGFMALLFCSLFWFAAPQSVPEHVSGYLEWEKQLFFSNESKSPIIIFLVAVTVFLTGLFWAFWHRSFLLGLILINAGTLMKIIVSVTLGDEFGTASVIPSLSSLAFINLLAFFLWRFYKVKRQI